MRRLTCFAALLITLCAVLTGAHAQSAYRCGDSYSQTPCPGGTPVAADDSRSKAQKAQSEAATKRDLRTANSMEKTRLAQEESHRRAAQKSADKSVAKPTPAKPAPGQATNHTKTKSKPPEYFTARAAADKKKKKSEPPAQSDTTTENARSVK